MYNIINLINLKKSGKSNHLYLQIENEIIKLICNGILKPGQTLPPTRELAKVLKVNRKTVIKSYEELNLQGWVEIKDRSGIYVSQLLPELPKYKNLDLEKTLIWSKAPGFKLKSRSHLINTRTDREIHEYSNIGNNNFLHIDDGFPDPRIAPLEELIREYRRFSKGRGATQHMMYGPEQGSYRLRRELVKYLNETRGLQIAENEILITKGTQMAIYLASQVLVEKGDNVFVPEPGYHGANQVFNLSGAILTYIPVDKEGMDIDKIENLCKSKIIPKLVYVIPHHHRPTTVTLSSDRRMKLIYLAQRYKFAILEDDYDYDYHFLGKPLLPLASMDIRRNIIYVGSFCKSIAPGIRIGFMIAPKILIEEAASIRKLIDRQGDQLLEESIAEMISNGEISRHMKKSNKIYLERLNNTCSLLRKSLDPYLTFEIPNGGLAIWAKYHNGISAKSISRKAANFGLKISDGTNYFFEPNTDKPDNFIRIGYSSLNDKEMSEAIKIWKSIIDK